MLELKGVSASYGTTQVLWDISMRVGKEEIISVMGPNGSGKSTILKSIIGLVKSRSGEIRLEDNNLMKVPTHEMVSYGIGMVLERRRLFANMTVEENLLMGAYHRSAQIKKEENLKWVESLFPIINERRRQRAGLMSGGEQQMVAIARGLMSRPRLLLMDEPFLGLAPKVVDQITDITRKIRDRGISVLFNEQNAALSFSISDRGYLLESGRIVLEGTGTEMLEHDMVKRVYLGV